MSVQTNLEAAIGEIDGILKVAGIPELHHVRALVSEALAESTPAPAPEENHEGGEGQ